MEEMRAAVERGLRAGSYYREVKLAKMLDFILKRLDRETEKNRKK